MGASKLPAPPGRRHSSSARQDPVTPVSLAEAVGAYEKEPIQKALKTTRGNRVQAAKLLESTERIVSYKVKKYNIDCRRFR